MSFEKRVHICELCGRGDGEADRYSKSEDLSLISCLLVLCTQRMCDGEPNPQVLQIFYAVLLSQFALVPSLMPVFASKLGKDGGGQSLTANCLFPVKGQRTEVGFRMMMG